VYDGYIPCVSFGKLNWQSSITDVWWGLDCRCHGGRRALADRRRPGWRGHALLCGAAAARPSAAGAQGGRLPAPVARAGAALRTLAITRLALCTAVKHLLLKGGRVAPHTYHLALLPPFAHVASLYSTITVSLRMCLQSHCSSWEQRKSPAQAHRAPAQPMYGKQSRPLP